MNFKIFNKSVLLIALLIFSVAAFAQDNKEDNKQKEYEQIQNLVNSKNYMFVAQSVLPLSGRTINLTSNYDLKVSPATVESDLPYFGRAFVAPVDPARGGIRFTSTQFSYTTQARKKGGWDITILPKDGQDVKQLFLNVTESGFATLQVVSNNRQQIGYNGYIKATKGKG